MDTKPLPIGMVLIPGIRSLAYVDAFRSLGYHPAEVILLSGDASLLPELRTEGKKFNYQENFFDIELDLECFLLESKVNVSRVETTSINEPLVSAALSASKLSHFIFTGGGIVSEQTLASGKELIHIHPGALPAYRGST
ncbi:MAG: hypothetical protein KDD53_12030, partial [Bdellovibrionales bacterium]|nr:hypothetical protein [Bdellovibrionales bacterium]